MSTRADPMRPVPPTTKTFRGSEEDMVLAVRRCAFVASCSLAGLTRRLRNIYRGFTAGDGKSGRGKGRKNFTCARASSLPRVRVTRSRSMDDGSASNEALMASRPLQPKKYSPSRPNVAHAHSPPSSTDIDDSL
mmetsp:Transcript_9502/g.21789  ORF Transcript_9502/g.21789 Transcript_9502/m.21789 type:complete len:134 (+) Transcript_9502:1217-1618(+)